jgi:hypothetical protein
VCVCAAVKLRAALTVSTFIAVLEKLNKLDASTCAKVREFVAANRCVCVCVCVWVGGDCGGGGVHV